MRTIFKNLINIFCKKTPFNYLYFLILFLFLISLNIRHFFTLEKHLSTLFLLYAIGQALFEISSFILILALIKKLGLKWLQFIFIAFSFVLCLVHFTDFTMIRLIDAPVSYLFKFLFCSGFLKVLQALNLNMSMIVICASAILFIPLLGPLFYFLSNLASKKKPIRISLFQTSLVLIGTVFSLLLLDLFATSFLNRPNYAKLEKTLPFKGTILHPSPQCITLVSRFKSARDEKETRAQIPTLSPRDSLPNIYLFVIETLRADYLNENTAPNMISFAKENLEFRQSFANSNGTQVSWFAIFHSDFPYHWTQMRDHWENGSIPLQLLKNLGYKIRVLSSADLRYFEMDQLLFGTNRRLVDTLEEYSLNTQLKPWERDVLAMKSFEKMVKTPEGRNGNVYLFFYDSTHSEYNFPPDFPLKFQPIVPQIDYLTLTEEKIEPIKNRYRNSIAFVDTLIGNFFSTLKNEGLFEESLIAITGDHGEEFFEEGALFHGTHLNRYQTQVPIFCKFPIEMGHPKTECVTHMDLFPTILHVLTGKEEFPELFDGQSLFSSHRWPYHIVALQNGPGTPNEFTISQNDKSYRLGFLNQNIYHQTQLELIDIRLPDGNLSDLSMEDTIHTQFPNSLDHLLCK